MILSVRSRTNWFGAGVAYAALTAKPSTKVSRIPRYFTQAPYDQLLLLLVVRRLRRLAEQELADHLFEYDRRLRQHHVVTILEETFIPARFDADVLLAKQTRCQDRGGRIRRYPLVAPAER